MKQYDHFFGVDVSKKTVDITYVLISNKPFTGNLPMISAGMEALMQWLKEFNPDLIKTLFCMEATGLYCFTLTQFLADNSIDTWIEHAAQIKKASSLDRRKK